MLASSIVLGTAAGLALGGSWRGLRNLQMRWWRLGVAAFAARVGGIVLPVPLEIYLGAILLVALVAVRNFRVPGALLIAVGSLLNALVIGSNGGMPVDSAAAATAGATPLLNDRLHIGLTAATRLPWLADVIPVSLFRNVYSVGDVVIAVGGFWIPFAVLRRK